MLRWVEHCLARGDCGRLLEPLLLSLLDPATARVSVLHATIRQQEGQGEAEGSYTISSTDSNTVFHCTGEEGGDYVAPCSKVKIHGD